MTTASPDSVASGRPLGLAVVGAGYWGPNLIRSSAASGRFEPRWVCDADPVRAERAAARSGSAQPTTDLDVVLADPAVDAVAVATPAWTHSTVAEAALSAGKHVLVEKPLATSSAEGRHLVELAEATGRVLMCDHTYCYTPAVQAIRDMVGSGEVGELLFIDSVRVNLGLIQPDVDVIWDLAPHDLAILDAILPDGCKPRAVAAHGADPVGAGLACLAHLNLDLPGGLPVALNLNWLSPVKVRRITIGGSRRTIVWDDLNPAMRITVYDRGVEGLAGGRDERLTRSVSYRIGDVVAPALPEREALVGVFESFATAITQGEKPLTDGRAGLRVLEVLEAATKSLGSGGRPIRPTAAPAVSSEPAVAGRRPAVEGLIPVPRRGRTRRPINSEVA
jgi:predicted dehydrogenase